MAKQDMAVLEAKLTFMQERFDNIEALIKEHIAHEDKQWDELMDKLDKKYASKNVEKIVYGAVGMILTSVFGALIYLVVQVAGK